MGDFAFDALVSAHHAEIYRYVRRLTGRASEADDLAQETFLRAYRARATLTADVNVRAWLFKVATNLCRNHFRSESRRRTAFAAAAVNGAAPPDDPEAARRYREAAVTLDASVAALPLKQRLAFTLRKVHGLPYDDVARALDCTPDTARAHVFQAFRKIRQSLNGTGLPQGEPR